MGGIWSERVGWVSGDEGEGEWWMREVEEERSGGEGGGGFLGDEGEGGWWMREVKEFDRGMGGGGGMGGEVRVRG